MWLSRLDLLSFGRFTNAKLALGQGFHLVYGPNEAGKSTTLRAIRQLLFGFDERTTDNFIHSNPNLRIGGVVCSEGGVEVEVIRRKARKDSLRSGDDTAIVDSDQWQELLGHVDEATFCQRYGIDYGQLVEGGRQIATGSGDLGEILFATGSGVMDLSAVRKGLADEADEIFRPQGKKQRLNRALAEWQDRKNLVLEKALSVSTWEETDRQRQETKSRLDEITLQWKQRSNECERNRRWLAACPVVAELDALNQQLEQSALIRRLPDDFAAKRQHAILLIEQANAEVRMATESIQQTQQEIDRLEIPGVFLAHSDEIAKLVVEWGSYQKAQLDRPNLVERRDHHSLTVEALLKSLGHSPNEIDLVDTVVDREQRTRMGLLGRQYAALAQSSSNAQTEYDRLVEQSDEAQTQLQSMPDDVPVDALQETFKKAQSDGDLEARLAGVRSEIAVLRDAASQQFQRIGHFAGSIDDLKRIRIPAPETLKQFERDLAENQSERSLLRSRLTEFESGHQELNRKIEEFRKEFFVPTDDDLDSARQTRTQIWASIRQKIDSKIVPADDLVVSFEESLDTADQIVDRLRHEADRVAQLAELLDDRTANEAAQHQASLRLAELEANRLEILVRWRSEWPDLKEAPLPPGEIQTWLARRETLLQNHFLAERREAEADELSRQIESHVASLSHLLNEKSSSKQKPAKKRSTTRVKTAVAARRDEAVLQQRLFDADSDLNHNASTEIATTESEVSTTAQRPLNELMAKAEATLAAHLAVAQRRKEAEELFSRLKNELTVASERLVAAKKQMQEWQSQWQAAMTELTLATDISPDAAEAHLVTLDDLITHRRQAEQLSERISGIDADADKFTAKVKSLILQLAPELDQMPVGNAVQSLGKLLSACQRDESIRNRQTAKRNHAEQQLANAKKSIMRGREIVADLCLEAGVECTIDDSTDEASAASLISLFQELGSCEIQSSKKKRLEAELLQVNNRLTQLAGEEPLAEFLTEIRQQSLDALESKVRELENELADFAQQRDQLHHQLGGFDLQIRQMDGGADAAEAEEERRVWLAQIRSDAEEYVRLRLASSVLRTAIDRYREKTRGPVLKIASELFRELTLESFEGLRVDEDDNNRPVIVGVRSGGREAVEVGGMSEGTCDQLYLALRIASLQLETAPRCHLPFIVDDILIQFDDARAAAALRVFARLAKQRQVIFFTHHDHLLEVANQHIPGEHKAQRLGV